MKEIIATYKYTLYTNSDGSFMIGLYDQLDGDKRTSVKIKGRHLPEHPGVHYKFTGEFENNPKYGESFNCISADFNNDDSRENIVSYLSCGVFKGIGFSLASKIYERFKENSLYILENETEKLIEIKGISESKIESIKKDCEAIKNHKELIMFLRPFGINPDKINEIEEAYKDIPFPQNITEKIERSPYVLYDVKGITISDCEAIALKYNYNHHDFNCFRAYALNILSINEEKGHIAMPVAEFGEALSETLSKYGFSTEELINLTNLLVKRNELVKQYSGNTLCICKSFAAYREYFSAKTLLSLLSDDTNQIDEAKAIKVLEEICEKESIVLDEDQKAACLKSLTKKVSIITGGGGVGKTTSLKLVLSCFEKLSDCMILCMTPTGKAARRMREVTGRGAGTIHSILEIGIGSSESISDIDKLSNTILVIDESSMIESKLLFEICKRVTPSCHIIFVGDANQLPSIGPGAIFRDLIESGVIPTSKLTKIYRTEEGSTININGQKVISGDTNLLVGSDFHIIECDNKDLEEQVFKKTIEMVDKYGLEDVMCLCPYRHNGYASTDALNQKLQNALNPLRAGENSKKVGNIVFHKNDYVMQTQANHPECANGDTGYITDIVKDNNNAIRVSYDINNSTFEYSKELLQELDLAYATTIHKAQGSESSAVVTCIADYHAPFLKRPFLYTDISRAKKEVWIYGSREAINKAILTEDSFRRVTLLKDYLCKIDEKAKENTKKEEATYKQLSFL